MAKETRQFNEVSSEFEVFRVILRHLWQLNTAGVKELSSASKVSHGTLDKWKYGITHSPRIDTMSKVLFSLGYDIRAVKRRRPNLRSVR